MKDDLYLDKSPLKMCSSMRYMSMPNIKLLSVATRKLRPMIKLDTNQPTNKHNGKNVGDIKMDQNKSFFSI